MNTDPLSLAKRRVNKLLALYHEKEMYGFTREECGGGRIVVIENLPDYVDGYAPHRLCILVELDDGDGEPDRIYATQRIYVIPDEADAPISKSLDMSVLNGELQRVPLSGEPGDPTRPKSTSGDRSIIFETIADEDDLGQLIETLESLPYEYEEAED